MPTIDSFSSALSNTKHWKASNAKTLSVTTWFRGQRKTAVSRRIAQSIAGKSRVIGATDHRRPIADAQDVARRYRNMLSERKSIVLRRARWPQAKQGDDDKQDAEIEG